MSNTNEAALEVQLKQRGQEESEFASTADAVMPRQLMEQEMLDLHMNLESLLPGTPRKVLQFTCSRGGEGVSTIVREYALVAAGLGKSVLIIDADQTGGGQKVFFNINSKCGWDDVVRCQRYVDGAFSRIGNTSLYVSCYSSQTAGAAPIADSGKIKNLLENLRDRFDLVLVDSSPANTGLDTTAFIQSVDGVILVVEAENTRWPVVENAKNRILSNGSKILGIVFNKRRNYIPDFIYTRM